MNVDMRFRGTAVLLWSRLESNARTGPPQRPNVLSSYILQSCFPATAQGAAKVAGRSGWILAIAQGDSGLSKPSSRKSILPGRGQPDHARQTERADLRITTTEQLVL